jgi:hypothetical protein
VSVTVSNGSASEWKQLFNGKDLEGWEHVGPGRFVVEDGYMKTEGGMGLTWYTRETFGDCVLRVVYKTTSDNCNSGVFVRIDGPPPDPWHGVHKGYEIQICDRAKGFAATGAIYSLSEGTSEYSSGPGEWTTMDITLDGRKIKVEMNGNLITDWDEDAPQREREADYQPIRGPRPTHGYIGLQNHDDGTKVSFREVSVKPLSK